MIPQMEKVASVVPLGPNLFCGVGNEIYIVVTSDVIVMIIYVCLNSFCFA